MLPTPLIKGPSITPGAGCSADLAPAKVFAAMLDQGLHGGQGPPTDQGCDKTHQNTRTARDAFRLGIAGCFDLDEVAGSL